MGAFPNNPQLQQKASIPLGVIIQPLAAPTCPEVRPSRSQKEYLLFIRMIEELEFDYFTRKRYQPSILVPWASSVVVAAGAPHSVLVGHETGDISDNVRTYINPFVAWIDGGRRWRCNICDLPNEGTLHCLFSLSLSLSVYPSLTNATVPNGYYCGLDVQGQRTDVMDRPELSKGIVEYVATAECISFLSSVPTSMPIPGRKDPPRRTGDMVRPPQPPVYFFVLDVSYYAVTSGVLQTAVETILESLDKLPGDVRTQFGLITYDNAVHYYSIKVLASPAREGPCTPLASATSAATV